MLADPLEHLKHGNREVFLVLQIEDVEAIECVEQIANVEGVDLLFVGPADLSLSLGVPLQFQHPKMEAAIDRVASAVARAGKWWGIPTGSLKAAQSALDRGARMVTCGSDHLFLVQGLQKAFQEFSDLKIR
jgi:2-keto-3-deoxy-L-rhamnonate aldolase RhmA